MRYNPYPRANARRMYGDVAQLGEHHVRNVGAEGSNPFISTIDLKRASGNRGSSLSQMSKRVASLVNLVRLASSRYPVIEAS